MDAWSRRLPVAAIRRAVPSVPHRYEFREAVVAPATRTLALWVPVPGWCGANCPRDGFLEVPVVESVRWDGWVYYLGWYDDEMLPDVVGVAVVVP